MLLSAHKLEPRRVRPSSRSTGLLHGPYCITPPPAPRAQQSFPGDAVDKVEGCSAGSLNKGEKHWSLLLPERVAPDRGGLPGLLESLPGDCRNAVSLLAMLSLMIITMLLFSMIMSSLR